MREDSQEISPRLAELMVDIAGELGNRGVIAMIIWDNDEQQAALVVPDDDVARELLTQLNWPDMVNAMVIRDLPE